MRWLHSFEYYLEALEEEGQTLLMGQIRKVPVEKIGERVRNLPLVNV